MMKTTGSVQEKNGRFYFVINLYDANGKRKIKWISTGLTVRGNKRKAESMLREVLLHYASPDVSISHEETSILMS